MFIALTVLAIGLCWPMTRLSDEAILHHPKGNTLGLPAFRNWSIGFTAVALVGVAALWTRLLSSADFWRRIAWRHMGIGLILIGLALALTYFLTDWSQGFRGPALIDNLYLQVLAAPAKPLVAHVLYFGPVFLVVMGLCMNSSTIAPQSFPLLVLLSASAPIFLMGSESRQWVYFLPIMVELVALNERSPKRWWLILGASIALCLPSVMLHPGLATSIKAHDGLGMGWWWYLAHHGPWMSTEAYLGGMVCIVLMALAYPWCGPNPENRVGHAG